MTLLSGVSVLEECRCLLYHTAETVCDGHLVSNPRWKTLPDLSSAVSSIEQDQCCVVVLVPYCSTNGLVDGLHAQICI